MSTKNKRLVNSIVLALLALMLCQGVKAADIQAMEAYRQWAGLPSKQLKEMALRFINEQPQMVDSALVCHTIIVNRYYDRSAKTEDYAMAAESMMAIGTLYDYYYFDYEKAQQYLDEALAMSAKHHLGLEAKIHFKLSNLYSLYAQINTPDSPQSQTSSLRLRKQAMSEALAIYGTFRGDDAATRRRETQLLMLNIVISLCDYAITTGRTADVQQELSVFDTIRWEPMPVYEYTRMQRLAVAQLHRGDDADALQTLQQSFQATRAVPLSGRLQATLWAQRARIMEREGRIGEAIAEVEKALAIADKSDAKDIRVDVNRTLYLLYNKLGQTEKATRHLLAYYQQKDSLLNSNKLGGLQEVRFRNELSQVNEQVRLALQRSRIYRAVMLAALVAAVVFLLMLGVLLRNYRRLNQKNQVLYQKAQQALAAPPEPNRSPLPAPRSSNISTTADATAAPAKYGGSQLDDDTRRQLMQHIRRVMDDTSIICQTDFSIAQLAEQAGGKQRYVSQVINESYEKGFNQMLAEYRIREACRRLSDIDAYGNYSIEGLSESLGFKSRSNFVSNFKRIVGMTPSEYKKQAQQG